MTTREQRLGSLTYEGRAYIRPVGRGVCLTDSDEWPQIEDWIANWLMSLAVPPHSRLRITVELLDSDADGLLAVRRGGESEW